MILKFFWDFHFYCFKRSTLEFIVFYFKLSGYGNQSAWNKAFFKKGAVKTNQFCRARTVVYNDFQGFHFAVTEPFVAGYLGNCMNFSVMLGLFTEGYFLSSVFVVAWKILQQISNSKNIYFSQSFCKLRADSCNRRNRRFYIRNLHAAPQKISLEWHSVAEIYEDCDEEVSGSKNYKKCNP